MATFMDVTLLSGARVILIFLLVYVVVWGLLVMMKPFGKDVPTGPYAIIALVAAFLSAISGTMRYLVEFVTPWFLFLILLLFFIIFIIRMFGLGQGDMESIIRNSTVHVLILAIIGIILLFGLGSAFGQKSLEATQGDAGGVHYQGYDRYAPGSSSDAEVGDSGDASSGYVYPGVGDTGLEPGQDLNYANTADGNLQPGQPGATATGSFSLNLINTLLHPKVMAIIALFLIATVTVWLMSRPNFA